MKTQDQTQSTVARVYQHRIMTGVMALLTSAMLAGCAAPPMDVPSLQSYYDRQTCEALARPEQIFIDALKNIGGDTQLRNNYQTHLNLIQSAQEKKYCKRKPLVGIELSPIDPVLARPLGLDSANGAVIKSVVKDMPGERAGMVAGDIILGVNGEPAATPADVTAAIYKSEAQGTVEFMLWRGGKKAIVLVSLGAPSDGKAATNLMDAATADFDAGRFADAARKYQQILQQSPNDALTWYFYGQTMEQLGDAVGAQDAYRRVLAIQKTGQVADYARQALARLSPPAKKAAKKK